MDITILELSFPDAEVNAPFADRHTASDRSTDPDTPTATSEGSKLRPVLIGLGIVGVVLIAKYLREPEASHTPAE